MSIKGGKGIAQPTISGSRDWESVEGGACQQLIFLLTKYHGRGSRGRKAKPLQKFGVLVELAT